MKLSKPAAQYFSIMNAMILCSDEDPTLVEQWLNRSIEIAKARKSRCICLKDAVAATDEYLEKVGKKCPSE